MSLKRCAIYTRKSSEEGLDQDFNSLEAQREACAAYILSQRHEGWRELPDRYDDGGISGGTMNRPGLARLLADVQAGRIDVVVVYKVDRLTRALSDFAKIVEIFDAAGVSFVSVTQAFNTTSSMGRLTLNVLLSFAQFEREVTAERIRDKIAASKRKGMWMGGLPPLGYDVKDRALVINDGEAETVRMIFRRYLDLGCVRALKVELDASGVVSKLRANGSGGKPISRGALHALLRNPVYIGETRHKGEHHPGLHAAILDRATWEAVQRALDDNGGGARTGAPRPTMRPLDGLLFDAQGRAMKPTHASRSIRAGQGTVRKRYWYYASRPDEGAPAMRMPAESIEAFVTKTLTERIGDADRLAADLLQAGAKPSAIADALDRAKAIAASAADRIGPLLDLIHRIDLGDGIMTITISAKTLIRPMASDAQIEPIRIEAPLRTRQAGRAKPIVIGMDRRERKPDADLIAMVADARRWAKELLSGAAVSVGEIERREEKRKGTVSRILPLAFLAPDLAEAILNGRQPETMTAGALRRLPDLPLDWAEQRRALGFDHRPN
ncbi:Site-specific DNA recombinase [Albimonas donghaensis]|uniref:Site-specific DNA recombinase n=1 Tax=Albimonas donghaensis TaxID=356660 RepID=A0A1H3G6M2_9RHOB|nr:recombinase family protein [Albimonas donghaensis]SDX98926.1 Site-specific DNA recombinase [Albimonas donghaensis]